MMNTESNGSRKKVSIVIILLVLVIGFAAYYFSFTPMERAYNSIQLGEDLDSVKKKMGLSYEIYRFNSYHWDEGNRRIWSFKLPFYVKARDKTYVIRFSDEQKMILKYNSEDDSSNFAMSQ